ncbi:MAG: hypothetical protein MJ153_07445 [Clostridia bacterium]|nr:hypothetical protein [Clostridia bacterium]
MKNSIIKKIALTVSVALAMTCCMFTGCSSETKETEKETTVEETVEETTTEETTTEETTEETAEEVAEETSVEETISEEVTVEETDLSIDMEGNTAEDFENDKVKEAAQNYIDKGFMVMKTDNEAVDAALAEHFVEGFIAMGDSSMSISVNTEDESDNSASGGMQIAVVVLFDDATNADEFLVKSFDEFKTQGFGDYTVEDTADGKKYSMEAEGISIVATLTNDGLCDLFESFSMG